MPPQPKPAATRRRRNKGSSFSTLNAVLPDGFVAPDLPDTRLWHHRTRDRWEKMWRSPMAPEFDLESDLPSMVAMAELWDDFYAVADDTEMGLEKKARLRKNLAGEMRLQEQRFGLSPLDRRRLQWEVDKGQEAEDRTQKRQNQKAIKDAEDKPDPRELLAG